MYFAAQTPVKLVWLALHVCPRLVGGQSFNAGASASFFILTRDTKILAGCLERGEGCTKRPK